MVRGVNRWVVGWTGRGRRVEGRDWECVATECEMPKHVLTLHKPFNFMFQNAGTGLNNS